MSSTCSAACCGRTLDFTPAHARVYTSARARVYRECGFGLGRPARLSLHRGVKFGSQPYDPTIAEKFNT